MNSFQRGDFNKFLGILVKKVMLPTRFKIGNVPTYSHFLFIQIPTY